MDNFVVHLNAHIVELTDQLSATLKRLVILLKVIRGRKENDRTCSIRGWHDAGWSWPYRSYAYRRVMFGSFLPDVLLAGVGLDMTRSSANGMSNELCWFLATAGSSI